MKPEEQNTHEGKLLEFVDFDREPGYLPLWEDEQVLLTCPVNVPVERWQTFLNESLEYREELMEEYPEDDQEKERQALLLDWVRENLPSPISLKERIQSRLYQIQDQKDLFVSENEFWDEETEDFVLPKECLPMYREFEVHQNWLRRRLETLWEPETPELKALDRELWVAENLWEDRESPEREIEDRLWDRAWELESLMIARHPL